MKKYFTKEVKIGLAGIAALCILIFGINFLKGIDLFKPSYHIYVKFQQVSGLAKSAPVFSDGFRVGIVRNLSYDYQNPGNVVVAVELNDDLLIPVGSHAELITGLMGDVTMNLHLGEDRSAKYAPGDTIYGKIAEGMLDRANSLIPQVKQILPKLDTVLLSLNTLLTNPNIAKTLNNVEHLTSSLAQTSVEINSIVKNDLHSLTGKLNTLSDNFIVLSDNLKDIDYSHTFNQIDSTLYNVKILTEKLNSKDNSLGLLLNETEFYDNLNATTENAASLLKDLQTNPKRYVHFSLFGSKKK